ncbi:MAG: alpha-amylase [Oscillospiraceae bacterium]|nr:alpha-amylase [Oscillospiraceae bacterium]
MAHNTDPRLQNQVIYSVYVRAHTPAGTFRAVIDDLDRIRALGTDIVWLMPIHPIGVQGKKGSLGCPYANRDYRGVNPAYGTLEDFRALADAIHARGMKLMIDVVYNHTSPDSVLWQEHPEFFYKKPDGRPGNKVGDWTDVIDLDYRVPALWDYQIESLCQWAEIVDGFRCDVASFVPLDFWKRARAAVEQVRPGCLWLAESVHLSFGSFYRRAGFYACRDTELFEAFDMEYEYDMLEYEYDMRECFDRYLAGKVPLSQYTDMLNVQEALYPANYNKLRFLENHDQPRIASLVTQERALINYTAMLYFLKGTTLLYAGQEFADTHLPSLFEREVIDRDTGRDLSPLLTRLGEIKRRLGRDDFFFARAEDGSDVAVMERENADSLKLGVFSLRAKPAEISVAAADGDYVNQIDGNIIPVRDGKLLCTGEPIILILPRH